MPTIKFTIFPIILMAFQSNTSFTKQYHFTVSDTVNHYLEKLPALREHIEIAEKQKNATIVSDAIPFVNADDRLGHINLKNIKKQPNGAALLKNQIHTLRLANDPQLFGLLSACQSAHTDFKINLTTDEVSWKAYANTPGNMYGYCHLASRS